MYKKYILALLLMLFVFVMPIRSEGDKPDGDTSGGLKPASHGIGKLTSEQIVSNMKHYQSVVEKVRGRKFKYDVPARIQPMAEYKKSVTEDLDKFMAERGQWYQIALTKLGLLPADYDLRKGMESFMISQVGAYYDPQTKSITLLQVDMPAIIIETMIFHELTHALQDQYFDISKCDTDSFDDKDVALKFLVEGEATYAMTLIGLNDNGISFSLNSPLLAQMLNKQRTMTRKEMENTNVDKLKQWGDMPPELLKSMEEQKKMPDYLFWVFAQPYLWGCYSIHRLMLYGNSKNLESYSPAEWNWDVIDALFKNYPESTEQMMHYNKVLEPRDKPVAITAPQLKDDWSIAYESTLGELGFWILFNLGKDTPSARVSSGWGGDKYFLIKNSKTKDIGLILSTTWDTPKAAGESFSAYQQIISKRYPDCKRIDTAKGAGETETTYFIPDNKIVVLTLDHNSWKAVQDVPVDFGK